MPRCHRNGNYHLNHNHRYGQYYYTEYGKKELNKPIPLQLLYRPSNSAAVIESKKQISLNSQLNQRKFNNLELKIDNIKSKINDEMNSRKNILKNHISRNKECFVCQEGDIYYLKQDFIRFILKKSKSGVLEKKKLKKSLKRIRFNLKNNFEDILIKVKINDIFSSDSFNSVLKLKSSEWTKWENLIKLIGSNINEYKLSIKEKELEKLHDEYDDIIFSENKEKIKICEKCGLENNRKAYYCYYCGNKF